MRSSRDNRGGFSPNLVEPTGAENKNYRWRQNPHWQDTCGRDDNTVLKTGYVLGEEKDIKTIGEDRRKGKVLSRMIRGQCKRCSEEKEVNVLIR